MINKDEMVFAVDEDNNPIEPVPRHQAHAEGIWHRTSDIIVINKKNEILCGKRSVLKDISPGLMDASFGGHMLAGVEPIDGALEELREESGLHVEPDDLEFIATVKYISPQNDNNKEFRYLYLYRWDGPMSDLNLEKDEIDEVKWVPLEIVKSNRDNRAEWSPMPYIDELIKKLEYKINDRKK